MMIDQGENCRRRSRDPAVRGRTRTRGSRPRISTGWRSRSPNELPLLPNDSSKAQRGCRAVHNRPRPADAGAAFSSSRHRRSPLGAFRRWRWTACGSGGQNALGAQQTMIRNGFPPDAGRAAPPPRRSSCSCALPQVRHALARQVPRRREHSARHATSTCSMPTDPADPRRPGQCGRGRSPLRAGQGHRETAGSMCATGSAISPVRPHAPALPQTSRPFRAIRWTPRRSSGPSPRCVSKHLRKRCRDRWSRTPAATISRPTHLLRIASRAWATASNSSNRYTRPNGSRPTAARLSAAQTQLGYQRCRSRPDQLAHGRRTMRRCANRGLRHGAHRSQRRYAIPSSTTPRSSCGAGNRGDQAEKRPREEARQPDCPRDST